MTIRAAAADRRRAQYTLRHGDAPANPRANAGREARELIRFLLLQARASHDPMLQREVRSFALHLGVEEEAVTSHNLLDGPVTVAEVWRHDALLIGGSGEYYVSKRNLPYQEELFAVLCEVAERGHPTFASCFGYQCMVQALGGEIVHDPPSAEVGTLELRLTAEGLEDPLFGQLPERFHAQLGRKDRAARVPEGVPNLAASDVNPHQALRIPGKPVWASQFHPELDGPENRARFERYLALYSAHMSVEERRQALARFHPSPEANTLLRRFVELVFGD